MIRRTDPVILLTVFILISFILISDQWNRPRDSGASRHDFDSLLFSFSFHLS